MRIDLYSTALPAYTTSLRENFCALNPYFPPPIFSEQRGWRHLYFDDCLCAYLKIAKLVSSLGALNSLINSRFLNEAGALVRICDDMVSESFFVLNAEGPKFFKFLRAFYLEELSDPARPLSESAAREGVTARRVRGEFASTPGHGSNSSDVQLVLSTIHRVYSGYVHGAYPHIMELYNGESRSFEVGGVMDERLSDSLKRDSINYTWRALCVLELLCKRMRLYDDYERVRSVETQFWRDLELDEEVMPLAHLR